MEKKKAKIIILGVYHFGTKGEHLINDTVADVMTDNKQQEIRDVLNKLSRFEPTKIAVEAPKARDKELNSIYLNYIQNKYLEENKIINSRNEIFQLGFRLGEEFKHSRIYPIDYPVDLPGEQVLEYAEKNCIQLYKSFMNWIENETKISNDMQKNNSVNEILKYLNNKKRVFNEHSDAYLLLNKVGAGGNYCGADMMTEWYRRNLRIFANLQNIVEEHDRILVIFGAGHCKILQELVSDWNDVELIDVEEYL